MMGPMSRSSPIVAVLRAKLAGADESLNEIARQSEVDKALLSKFVRGIHVLSGENLDRLARYFEMELRPRGTRREGK